MLVRLPWEWEVAICCALNLAEMWSLRPEQRPSSQEISDDEGLGRTPHYLSRSILPNLVKAGVLTHQRKQPMGYRLARTPSRITLYDIVAGVFNYRGEGVVNHLSKRLPRAEIRRYRSSRGLRCPGEYAFGGLDEFVTAYLKRITLSKMLAANLGLTAKVLYRDAYAKSRYPVSLLDRVRPVLLEFCPLVENWRGSIIAWAHSPVADPLLNGFEMWMRALHKRYLTAPRRIGSQQLYELRLEVQSFAGRTEPGATFGKYRIWERNLATHHCHDRAGYIAAVQVQPWRGYESFQVFCTDRERLLDFAASVRFKDTDGITEDGPGAPLPPADVGQLTADGCWSYIDRRRDANDIYRGLAGEG